MSAAPLLQVDHLTTVFPVSGREVAAVNESLDATPELVNSDPYGGGWLYEVVPADAAALDDLMDSAAYQATLGE